MSPNLEEVTHRRLFSFGGLGTVRVSRFSGISRGGFAGKRSDESDEKIVQGRGAGRRMLTRWQSTSVSVETI